MKLIKDILTENKIYSLKRVYSLVLLIFILTLGAFIVVSDKILEKEVNHYAIEIFNSLLMFLGLLIGVAVVDKKITNKVEL
jgi:hypothetical protein